MTEGLKPCPFCGREAETRPAFGGITVITCDCGAIVSFLEKETLDEAIVAWNRRDGNADESAD